MKKKVKKSTGAQREKGPILNSEEVKSGDLLKLLLNGFGSNASEEGRKAFLKLFSAYLKQEVEKEPIAKKYNILILFDNTTLAKIDSDQIYSAVKGFEENKEILLVVLSNGGDPGAAYLIGKLCQEYSNGRFIVVVPRYAKSAATLLCCAAQEIHMGSLSELGPIDPQIERMPTLGLKNSIEHIAKLVKKTPESGEMFAKYLSLSVKPVQIGYYERVAESVVQYAEKLLQKNFDSDAQSNNIAKKLVYGYKDHGFVIDKTEAGIIFGEKMVKADTPEYRLGNRIYEILSEIEDYARFLSHRFLHIGSISSEPILIKRS